MSATLPSVAAIIMLAAVSMPEQAYAQDALPNSAAPIVARRIPLRARIPARPLRSANPATSSR